MAVVALVGLVAAAVVGFGSGDARETVGARASATLPVAVVDEATEMERAPARGTQRPPAAEAPVLQAPTRPAPARPRVAAEKADDEADLMQRLRRIRAEDPELAVQLAREGNARFPDSDGAPERASVMIHALAALGRPSEARGEAEQMVNDYPDTPWAAEIEAFTGAHPHRNH
jgi:hypothetical protein